MDRASTWIWTALLLVGLVASFLAAFGIGALARQAGLWPTSSTSIMRIDLALLLALMGALGTLAVFVAGRLAFGRWPAVGAWHVPVPVVGVALAIAIELALHEWARVHIGQYEFDHMLPTALLSTLVILTAVACLAVLVAPAAAAGPPLVGLAGATALVALVVMANVPGLRDGVEAESWPLAILVGLSAAYAITAFVIGARRVRAG